MRRSGHGVGWTAAWCGHERKLGRYLAITSSVVLCAAAAVWVSTAAAEAHATRSARFGPSAVRIVVLSNRADLVSGREALVAVLMPAHTNPAGLRIMVGKRDVTRNFTVRHWRGMAPSLDSSYSGLNPRANAVAGEVTGLKPGPNVVMARLRDGSGARITITDHSLSGPLLSGPQLEPWTCQPGALDAQCDRRTTYTYQYLSSKSGAFAPYDPANPPSDVATTTTQGGKTVPFIVRVENGVIDRDDYAIAMLYDPKKPWAPWSPQPQFNRKALFVQGASCGIHHGESSNTDLVAGFALDAMPSVLTGLGAREALGLGFATITTALDNAAHNCNIAVQSEAVTMVKQHFIDTYGPVRYTIAMGVSGGSLSENQDENAYPGLYQGMVAERDFDDAWSNGIDAADCQLMLGYFENSSRWASGVTWTTPEQLAAEGKQSPSVCVSWVHITSYWTLFDPSSVPTSESRFDTRNCGVPDSEIFNAQTNPHGVRCTLQDYMVDVFGRAANGYANSPRDNVGVEYGLSALMAHTITPAQFADLNAKAGSYNINYSWQHGRQAADLPALSAAYRSGAVNDANNLATVPIIDEPGYSGDIHETYHSYALSDRMVAAYGNHANHIIWCCGATTPDPLLAMDRWVNAISRDHSPRLLSKRVVRDKPADVQNICVNGGVQHGSDQASCQKIVASESTRAAAGAPYASDVLKCQLKPLRRSDFGSVQFSDPEWRELEQVFPRGVCDWSKPGVDQQATVPWQTYMQGPGGHALGRPPVSVALGAPSKRR